MWTGPVIQTGCQHTAGVSVRFRTDTYTARIQCESCLGIRDPFRHYVRSRTDAGMSRA